METVQPAVRLLMKATQRVTSSEETLRQLKEEHTESIRKVKAKQETEMMEHLMKSKIEFEPVLEEKMRSKVELMNALQLTVKEVSAFTKFLPCVEAMEIAKQVHSDGLLDRDTLRACEKASRASVDFTVNIPSTEA